MLCVATGLQATVTMTQIASGSSPASNGKEGNAGQLNYNHTTYKIEVGAAGDLASYEYSASDVNDDVEYGAYFEFHGTMNKADMQSINGLFASKTSYEVYMDFSAVEFVDEKGAAITDGSLIKDINNSKVQYVVLPDNTVEINAEGWPANITEAIAVNSSTHQFLGYATYDGTPEGGAGTLEHLIAFDHRAGGNANIFNYTLSGTYWHQSEKYNADDYKNVFYLLSSMGIWNGEPANIKNLDLKNATMLSYGEIVNRELVVNTQDGRTFTYHYDEDSNAMVSINIYGGILESLILPETEGTELIPFKAFNQCRKLTEVNVPGNIKQICTAAFQECSGLKNLTFNKGLTNMGSNCFDQCTALESVVLPTGLKNVGNYAFVGCQSLKEIVIPEGVETLEVGCFERTNISSVRLPNSLKYIHDNVFRECKNLKTITIPENVEEIGSNAFALCNKITDVYFLGTTTIPKAGADAFESELYYHNNTANNGEYERIDVYPPVVLPDYPEAGDHRPTEHYQRYKVKLSTWATFKDGEKVDGCAVLHYPRVKTEAGYSETDYAASYQNYQSDLAAYNTAVEEKAEDLAAYERAYQEYQENLQKYNEAMAIELCWADGRTCTLADAISYNQFYTKEYGEFYKKIAAWQPQSEYAGYTYYTLKDGEYTIIDPKPSNYNEFKVYEDGTGLFVKIAGEQVVPLDDETIAVLKAGEPTAPTPVEGIPTKPTAPVVYTYDGTDYTAYSGEPIEGVEYYVQTSANDDIYAEYYTVPNRNKSYGGTYYGDSEDNVLNSETWPDQQDMAKFSGGQNSRKGLPTPDGTPAGTYDGLKNFLLAAGYPEEGEEQTPPVQKIDHIKKDVWYTMCFPFDLTDDQLESCFGAGYEVAQFCGVVENEEKTGIILQFTDAVTPDANGVVTKAHVPYMIHPNSMAVNEDGTPKETVFTLTGVKETQKMHDADQKVLMQHAVTKYFNGTPFTFVGYGHNYLPSQVLIPQFAYFLGTKKGETYPRFFRQTGANDRASKSYWNKNIAVVLPGVDKNVASTINFSKIDSRVINSETEGKQVYEVWDYEEGYYNYICNEYKYVPSASASGVKSLANFDLQIVHTPLTETQPEEATAIEAVEKADSFVAADKFGKVYNISGQYVGKDLNNLPKGVYILNGKKYMVK